MSENIMSLGVFCWFAICSRALYNVSYLPHPLSLLLVDQPRLQHLPQMVIEQLPELGVPLQSEGLLDPEAVLRPLAHEVHVGHRC